MPKWKMIGIRVPEGSDLPARFKEVSEKSRLSYCEFLEKFVTQAEAEINTPPPNFDTKDIISLQALVEKFSDLNLHVHEIEARLKALEQDTNQVKYTNALQAIEATDAAGFEHTQEVGSSDSDYSEQEAVTITYIRRLSAEGMSLRKIAERLKSEKIPTLSGSGVWHHGTVQKILSR
jgi:DNA-binding transcriptional MerR regulator